MPWAKPHHEQLFENHLAFMALHRGPVRRTAEAILLDSEEEDFRCTVLTARSVAPASAARVVRTMPWNRGLGRALGEAGFVPKGELLFLSRSPGRARRGADGPLRIDEVTTPQALDVYSRIQAESFLLPGESLEHWHAYLHRANAQNLGRPGQTFLLGRVDGQPVSVILLLEHAGALGIYAVGTLPAHRGKGYAGLMLQASEARALRRGCERLTLQVYGDTPAERLYRGLGFTQAFGSAVWLRP